MNGVCMSMRILFEVAVDAGPVRGFASHARAAYRGQDRGDDLDAQGQQGGDGARGQRRNAVAAAARLPAQPAAQTTTNKIKTPTTTSLRFEGIAK